MLKAFIRLFVLVQLGAFLILAGLPIANKLKTSSFETVSATLSQRLAQNGLTLSQLLRDSAFLALLAFAAAAALYFGLKKLERYLDAEAGEQASLLNALDAKYADAAIVLTAAASLFLELAIIRWQSSVLVFLSFYKNFTLIACFVGLGLGYSLASRTRIPLLSVIPMIVMQIAFMMMIQLVPGVFHVNPFQEELAMGYGTGDVIRTLSLYAVLTVIFLGTAMIFLPVGQLCGRMLERRGKLRAYGLNLLGSLLGVLFMLFASFLWMPPLVWFALSFLALLVFHQRSRSLISGVLFSVVGLCLLAWWPVDPFWNRVYSPYQLLEVGISQDTGMTNIRAAGHYYQRVWDLSGRSRFALFEKIRDYYDFPYKAHAKAGAVVVVGAGTGNDVAAALRAGSASVDAIEIDPAILMAGQLNHPEDPYHDKRTTAVVNDARSFLRTTQNHYDLIVYGLLDSHTLLSQGSSVRLDSFVYTVEGLREARNRLKPDGVLSLSFTVLSDALGRKISMMLQEAFDGRAPVSVSAAYDGAIIFLASNDPNWTLPAGLLQDTGFIDQTKHYGNPSISADVSTDDWPFFYMPKRVYPTSYLYMGLLVLALSFLFGRNFSQETPKFSHLSFFFLGAGFMLIETKGITEMGLTFGNTWLVIGVVIAGILIMAFIGNCLVGWLQIRRPLIPFVLLWSTLAVGWWVAAAGGFPSTPLGRLETAIILTCPLLFSGIVFSVLLSAKGEVSGIMAINLLGAIFGGLLEYNSMYFGFRSLYLVAMACYVLAFLTELPFGRKGTESISTAGVADSV